MGARVMLPRLRSSGSGCTASSIAGILAAWGLLLAGQLLPLVSVSVGNAFFSTPTDTVSLWSAIRSLFENGAQLGATGLAWFLLLWSGIFPHAKLVILALPGKEGVGSRRAHVVGSANALRVLCLAVRASLVDVFVLALVLALAGGDDIKGWAPNVWFSLGAGADCLLFAVLLLLLLCCQKSWEAGAKAGSEVPPALPGNAPAQQRPTVWSVRNLSYGSTPCSLRRLLLDLGVHVYPLARLGLSLAGPVLAVSLSSAEIPGAAVQGQPSTIMALLGAVWRNGSPALAAVCACLTVVFPLLEALHTVYLVHRSADGPSHGRGLARAAPLQRFCALDMWLLAVLLLAWQTSSGRGGSALVAWNVTVLPAGMALAAIELVVQPMLRILVRKSFADACACALAVERLPLLQ